MVFKRIQKIILIKMALYLFISDRINSIYLPKIVFAYLRFPRNKQKHAFDYLICPSFLYFPCFFCCKTIEWLGTNTHANVISEKVKRWNRNYRVAWIALCLHCSAASSRKVMQKGVQLTLNFSSEYCFLRTEDILLEAW